MYTNYSGESIFALFENRFLNQIYTLYPHIIPIQIECYTSAQYGCMSTAEPIEGIENDGFAYSIRRGDNHNSPITAYIIYSPEIIDKIGLNELEKLACIAHEVGHIIHYFNENLRGANNLIVEIKADCITEKIGLSSHLKSALNKLLLCGLYSDFQREMMRIRQNLLGE